MKRYIKCNEITADDTAYTGYCSYTASNNTWGYDSWRLLKSVGGEKGYMKLPNDRGSYYRPGLYYLFESEDQYHEFKQLLDEHDLSGFIQLYKYRNLPADAVILGLGL